MKARFIGDNIRMEGAALVEVGDRRGIGSGQSRVRAAKGWGGKHARSFVLRTYIVGRMAVKKLYID